MKLDWSKESRRDLRRIQFYYESIGLREAGLQAARHVIGKCLILRTFPYLGALVVSPFESVRSYRKYVAEKYVIYYTVQDDQVVIAAVIDGRKDPQDLRNRLK
jgi:plasmid stabilization system protein ParE